MEKTDDSFSFFNENVTDADRAENDQFNLLDSMEYIELWPPGQPCQICWRTQGFEYADEDHLVNICDDCLPITYPFADQTENSVH